MVNIERMASSTAELLGKENSRSGFGEGVSLTQAGSIKMAVGAADQLIKVLSGKQADWVVNRK